MIVHASSETRGGNRLVEEQDVAGFKALRTADRIARDMEDTEDNDSNDISRDIGGVGGSGGANAGRDSGNITIAGELTVDLRHSHTELPFSPGLPPGLTNSTQELTLVMDRVGMQMDAANAGIERTSGTQGRDAGDELREMFGTNWVRGQPKGDKEQYQPSTAASRKQNNPQGHNPELPRGKGKDFYLQTPNPGVLTFLLQTDGSGPSLSQTLSGALTLFLYLQPNS